MQETAQGQPRQAWRAAQRSAGIRVHSSRRELESWGPRLDQTRPTRSAYPVDGRGVILGIIGWAPRPERCQVRQSRNRVWSSWRWRVDSGGEEEVAACMYLTTTHHTPHMTPACTHTTAWLKINQAAAPVSWQRPTPCSCFLFDPVIVGAASQEKHLLDALLHPTRHSSPPRLH